MRDISVEELITSSVSVEPDLPDRTKRSLVGAALRRWRRHKKYFEAGDSVSALEEALQIELGRLVRGGRPYTTLLFLNLDRYRSFEFRSVDIRGDTLRLPGWDELDHLDTGDLWERIGQLDRKNAVIRIDDGHTYPQTWHLTPVTVSLESYDADAAVAIAAERFDVLRAALNLSSLIGKMTMFETGRRRAFSKFLPSPAYGVFDGRGGLLVPYFTTEQYQYRRQTVTQGHHDSAEMVLKIINGAVEGSTGMLLLRLLRLYQQALDLADSRATYLGLWQVLEGVKPDSRMSRVNVESTIKALINLDPLMQDVLDSLAKRRHELVHSGVFPDEPTQLVSILKIFVETALVAIQDLTKSLHTEAELREYITHSTLGDSTLESRKRVIEFVQSQRKRE